MNSIIINTVHAITKTFIQKIGAQADTEGTLAVRSIVSNSGAALRGLSRISIVV